MYLDDVLDDLKWLTDYKVFLEKFLHNRLKIDEYMKVHTLECLFFLFHSFFYILSKDSMEKNVM